MQLKKCKPIHITFWDHAQCSGDDNRAIKCEAIGILYKEDKLCYYICSWICDRKVKDNNSDCYSILKSTVIRKKYLKDK